MRTEFGSYVGTQLGVKRKGPPTHTSWGEQSMEQSMVAGGAIDGDLTRIPRKEKVET